VQCPNCATMNREGARFCLACGTRLVMPDDEVATPDVTRPEEPPTLTAVVDTPSLEVSPPAPPVEPQQPALPGESPPEIITPTVDATGEEISVSRPAVAEAAAAGEETAVDTPALGLRPAATPEGSLQPATLKESPHDVTTSTTEEQVEETEPPESTPPRDLDAPATEPTEDAGPEPEPAALLQDTAPLPEEPIPPLPPGALIAGRFQIIEVLEPGIEVNLYSVHDLAICPVCSFEGNQPEDEFCSECGAELKSTDPPVLGTIQEALSPDAINAVPDDGIFHDGRFYLPLPEERMVAVPEAEPAFPYGMTLSVGYASDVGIVRDLDEDSLCVFTLSGVYESVAEPTMGLFIVADGMGGHEGGEVASKLTVQIIANQLIRNVLLRRFTEEEQPLGEAVRDHLEGAISDANERVFHLARERANDMGCTLTMALVLDGKAYIANVGDSRTYIRGQEGRQADHYRSLRGRQPDRRRHGRARGAVHPSPIATWYTVPSAPSRPSR